MRRLLLLPLVLAAILVAPASASAAGLDFDGVNDYVEAGLDPTANESTTARTWEAWVKTTSSGYLSVVGRYRHGGGSEPWILTVLGGTPILTMNGAAARSGSVTVNDGEWHHIAAVWEPGTRLDMYVDGEVANGALSGTVPSTLSLAPGVTMRIGVGHYAGALYGFFDGEIDGVRYSEGARYSSAFVPDVTPEADAATIALWNFDEGTGTTTATEGQVTAGATLLNGVGWTSGV